MRKFETGGTRDNDTDKIDYEGFLSYPVLVAFGKYMHKHRIQADGNVRDSDNWQKFFGENHKDVCMKSLHRHFMSMWGNHRGYETEEEIEDSINGVLFNTIAYYHKYLHDKKQKNNHTT